MDGLSFEGLLAQARRVALARWPALLVVAGLWGLVSWGLIQSAPSLFLSGVFGYDDMGDRLFAMVVALTGVIGMAVMISLIVRIDLPGRSPGAIIGHAAVASLTLLLTLLLLGLVVGGLAGLGWLDSLQGSWLAYPLSFLPAALRYGLFAFLGMMIPAALERPVGPVKAASVSLRLTKGRRWWLAMIALVWTVGMSIPAHALNLLLPGLAGWLTPFMPMGAVLGAFGLGVLYRELRRLHTAGLATPVGEDVKARADA